MHGCVSERNTLTWRFLVASESSELHRCVSPKLHIASLYCEKLLRIGCEAQSVHTPSTLQHNQCAHTIAVRIHTHTHTHTHVHISLLYPGVEIRGVVGRGREANGSYRLVPQEYCGGKPVYKKMGGDIWIEFNCSCSSWQVVSVSAHTRTHIRAHISTHIRKHIRTHKDTYKDT